MNHILMSECMMTAAAQSPERGTLGETGVGLLRSALLRHSSSRYLQGFRSPYLRGPTFYAEKEGPLCPPQGSSPGVVCGLCSVDRFPPGFDFYFTNPLKGANRER